MKLSELISAFVRRNRGSLPPISQAQTQAAIWLSRNLLFYPEFRLQMPGSFVPPVPQEIDPRFVSRITAAYKLAMNHSKGAGDSMWSHISERSRGVHESLLAQDHDRITKILEDPIPTNLFVGYYSVMRDINLDEASPEAKALRDWAVHQIFECLVRVAEATGATRLRNPESTHQPRCEESVTPALLEALLARLDSEIGVRIDFPNPIRGEFGLPSTRGIASYRAPHAIYQAWRTRKLLQETNGEKVLEIGAGMGRTAYYAARLGVTDFTIVDLPLANVAQANFLGRVLGPDAIWLPGDPASDQAERIRICTPDWLANTDEQFDVVLNVDSITEMDFQHALDYVHKISSCAASFLSINHEDNPQPARELVAKCGIDARALRYPYWLRKGYVEEIFFFERKNLA